MLKIKWLIIFLLAPCFAIAQQPPEEYYHYHYKIFSEDTIGLHEKIFVRAAGRGNIYSVLAKADYLLYAGKTKEALNEFTNALSLVSPAENDSIRALVNSRIGSFYYYNDNYPEALRYFNKASLYYNYDPKNYMQAKAYVHMGQIHHTLGSRDEAEKNYRTAMDFYRKKNDTKRVIATQNNMAILLIDKGNFDLAQAYFDSCLNYRTIQNDLYGIGQTLNNIGTLNFRKENYNLALKYFTEGYEYRIKGKVPEAGIIESQVNIGKTHWKLGDRELAVYWLEQGFGNAKRIGHYDLQRRASEQLKDLYVELNDYKKALIAQENFFLTKDSLFGLDKKTAVENFAMQNQLESKIMRDSISSAEKFKAEKMMSEEKEKRNRVVVFSLATGMLFLLYFIFQLYKTAKQRKKTNAIILQQKDSLDQKQKEIVDSINYAKRIQLALLAHDDLLKKNLPEHFVFYQPKDIVSGDFYWATEKVESSKLKVEGSETGNNASTFNFQPSTFYLAVCDSTGHGVPGAFMSLLNTNYLNEAINEKNMSSPGEVFDYVRKKLVENISTGGARDGMDGVLLKMEGYTIESRKLSGSKLNVENTLSGIQPSTHIPNAFGIQLSYAAANNSPVIIRNNTIIELPFDKMPVGKSHSDKNFQLFTFNLLPGDMLYLFTDGYADQFGGEDFLSYKAGGKKFKKTNLKKFFLQIAMLPAAEQKQILKTNFEKWCGDLEQIDDVCIIGVRL